jgi:ribonuclease BN (tRNA processing enzyme)
MSTRPGAQPCPGKHKPPSSIGASASMIAPATRNIFISTQLSIVGLWPLSQSTRSDKIPAMDLLVLGSSDAFNGAGRCHAAYALKDGDAPSIVVDFGATTLYALHRAGLRGTDVAGVVITHLHGDHYGGLPFLLLDGMYHDVRSTPLSIVGAVGLEHRLGVLFEALYTDVAHRERPFATTFDELHPQDVKDLLGYRIEAFAALHMDPPDVPLCLRITGPSGKVVAFSGDTEVCDGFRDASRGADLLVAECSCLTPPCGRHITWQDWQDAFPKMKAKRILLTHLGQPVRDRVDELAKLAPSHVSFADDGMQLTV